MSMVKQDKSFRNPIATFYVVLTFAFQLWDSMLDPSSCVAFIGKTKAVTCFSAQVLGVGLSEKNLMARVRRCNKLEIVFHQVYPKK